MPTTRAAKLAELTPDAHNANRHTERGTGMLEKSLRRFGAGRSILVDKAGKVIAGNGVLEGAASIGLEDVLIVQTDGKQLVAVQRTDLDLDSPEARELAIADNRTAEVGLSWSGEELGALAEDVDLSDWFGGDELADILKEIEEPKEAPEPREDIADELRVKWGTERGQVWTVGKHRLMCGDSTDAGDVAKLMEGKNADACLTDPPYGVGFEYASTDDTEQNLEGLIAGFLPLARKTADVVLLTPGNKNQSLYPRPVWTLAWFVPAGTGRNPWGFSCWQPILAYGADPYLKTGKGSHPDAFVMTESSPDMDHPCPKPEGVWTWLLERCTTKSGQSVYDPFLGSGTTMVTAEQLGRVCYGMEIEPKYVAVTLERMQDMGLTPTLAPGGE